MESIGFLWTTRRCPSRWTRAGHIKVNLGKKIDIRRLDRLIADAVFGTLDGHSDTASPASPGSVPPAPPVRR